MRLTGLQEQALRVLRHGGTTQDVAFEEQSINVVITITSSELHRSRRCRPGTTAAGCRRSTDPGCGAWRRTLPERWPRTSLVQNRHNQVLLAVGVDFGNLLPPLPGTSPPSSSLLTTTRYRSHGQRWLSRRHLIRPPSMATHHVGRILDARRWDVDAQVIGRRGADFCLGRTCRS